MKFDLEIQKKIVPEVLELLEKRYDILTTIYYNQPIGRRMLASYLGIGERIVRTEVNFFKKQNLVDVKSYGMTITDEGREVLEKLKEFVHDLKGLSEMEKFIEKHLNLKKVIVVPGNVDENELVLDQIGRTSANFLKTIIKNNYIIALTGGTTIKKIVDNVTRTNEYKDILVVPARGGLGRSVQIQANTLAAKLADKLSADYKMLQLMESVDYKELFAIFHEESIKEVIEYIHKADILIYGVGKADEMAKRRGIDDSKINELSKKGAVGEAFGCYFNRKGQIVVSTPTAGIKSEDTKKIKLLIAIAGGESKAEAIISVQRYNSKNILITDEGAAKKIIDIIKNENTNKDA
ncbi:sugar-binding transcriptional regulator [Clostridium aestuarii]|uniref:Sugar-binding transcriptional regulator n=1 Tax=Clostridium aestuarii TaxID=338193 RepID=A0ABT4CVY0_9CLOT|nr:sugar-binding domain-containing protein [Clostridium aestuarii]MCY6483154.1 sugar-binding transcriptional regulator [Clostridium aestuarii]